MQILVTPIYASILAILMLVLGYRVAMLRRRLRVGTGHGGDKQLRRYIRVHGNALENIIPALILMLIYELNGGPHWLLHSFGGLLLAGRLLHAHGLSQSIGATFGRFWGMVLSWLVIAGLAVVNLGSALQAYL